MIVGPGEISWETRAGSKTDARAKSTRKSKHPARRLPFIPTWLFVTGMVLCLAGIELKTSWFQSRVLAAAARRLAFRVESGASPSIIYPKAGPYNFRLGYTRLPGFLDRLRESGYEITAQARSSPWLLALTSRGIFPIYHEKDQAGLRILDRAGKPLFLARYPQRTYPSFEAIPPLVVKTLLFIENREILDPGYPYRNPSVEWDRLAKAMLDLSLHKVYPGHALSGGSTLATQLEKVRHSPDGRTRSVGEKLRQMASASLRAYKDGSQTLEARKRIIRDYINAIPLAGQSGYGEVYGLGDGLWAWYGADFEQVSHVLAAAHTPIDEWAVAYRQVLSLLLALNQPSAYLVRERKALEERVDRYLYALCAAGMISPQLRDAVLRAPAQLRRRSPSQPSVAFEDRKGTDAVRAALLARLGLESVYDLDRLDLTVKTALDAPTQEKVTRELQRLNDPAYAGQAGLIGYPLISQGDPSSVIYSFVLYERGAKANLLRVQADNYPQPLNINEGTRLELGSTAKLRTLVTYLEIVAQLHERLGGAATDEIAAVHDDPITRWAIGYLRAAQDKSLPAMLEAAMNRAYSANPAESFFTGGGLHQFANFDSKDNGRVMTVREAFQRSVNLVFIRLMRDIANYYVYRVPGASRAVLARRGNPARAQYLERFADWEGRKFLGDFHEKYRGLRLDEALHKCVSGIRMTPKRLAVIYRSVRPDVGLDGFAAFLIANLLDPNLSDRLITNLYQEYAPGRFNLADRAYLAGIHPLELWLLEYKREHPEASLEDVVAASARQRQQSYQWLFDNRNRQGQDSRIRTMMEIDAFREIHKSWRRLGYPFGTMVPSYASAIGSSGDNPAALAELVGIIVSDGVRLPAERISELHFAGQTPVETVVTRRPEGGLGVLPAEVARRVRHELIGVVEKGTGRRAYEAIQLPDGSKPAIGGKTGTGDNRFETYGNGGELVASRVLNRTATFVFFIGDRFFGVVTAYVPGEMAAGYRFTSALPVQIFKRLAPALPPVGLSPAKN